MNNSLERRSREQQSGDTAVDGVIGGLMAGTAMMLLLVLAGAFDGNKPLQTLGYFDPAGTGAWLTGLLAHFAVSAIYGAMFALLLRLLGRLWPALYHTVWIVGIGYGLILLMLAQALLLSSAGSGISQIGGGSLALAHMAYGLLLALQLGRIG